METKYVIFVFISTFLLAAIYSSSMYSAHAATAYCTKIRNGQSTCFKTVGDNAVVTVCQFSLSHPVCKDYVTGKIMTKLPADLKKALNTGEEQIRNATNVPITNLFEKGGVLEVNNTGANNSNNTGNDNVKVPKAPKVPEDLGGLNDNSIG